MEIDWYVEERSTKDAYGTSGRFISVYCDGWLIAEALETPGGWVSLQKERTSVPTSLELPLGVREVIARKTRRCTCMCQPCLSLGFHAVGCPDKGVQSGRAPECSVGGVAAGCRTCEEEDGALLDTPYYCPACGLVRPAHQPGCERDPRRQARARGDK